MPQSIIQSRFDSRFNDLKEQGQKAFIPFTLLGWPTPEKSLAIINTLIDNGAHMLELGLPFSDPMADGPLIEAAASETLQNGFRLEDAWAILRQIRQRDSQIPISLMAYYNLILARGSGRFFQEAAEAGVDGILIVDLPPELSAPIVQIASETNIAPIFIVSPLTTPDRLKHILTMAKGYLYVVSRLGITGVEERYDSRLQELLTAIQTQSSLPACVGFGISTPLQAKNMLELGADGVITGSKIIQLVRESLSQSTDFSSHLQQATLGPYVREMVEVTH